MLTAQNRNSQTLLPQYVPSIVVANTCEAWIRAWHKRIERGFISAPPVYQKNHKQRFDWHIARKADVVYVLKKVLPYLIVKKQQAVLVLELIENKNTLSRNGDNAAELLWRQNIYQSVRRLNFRPGRASVETIRQTSQVEGDIVRAAEPSAEQHANVAAL